MRRLAALVVMCGCSGDDAPELDAAATDAEAVDVPSDGVPPIDAEAAACIVGSPPAVAPVAGTYCATWTHIDGIADPFARYYERADVTANSVRWWSSGSGGQKQVTRPAGIVSNCLVVAGFSANGGQMTSDPITLCWSDAPRACGAMTWRQPPLQPGHWAVQLDACP